MMVKRFSINDNSYTLECYTLDSAIAVKVYKSKSPSFNNEPIFYKTLQEMKLLRYVGLSIERRLEWKVKKAIRLINKDGNKSNGLQKAVDHVNSIFNLDKHMDL